MRRVAITGLGVVSPLGNGARNFFERLVQGRSGVTRLPEDFHPRLTSRVVAPVSFDGAAHFGVARLRMLDRVSQFALVAAAEAIADAGGLFEHDDRNTTGVFVGTGMGGAQSTDEGYQTVYEERSERVKPYSVLMAMNNAAAAWIGIDHQLLGPNFTFSSACSSSSVAIGEAWKRIATGELDVMVAGGSEAPLTFGTLKAWEALKTMAQEDPEDPSASCKPFAKNRSGLVLGEGAAMVILEAWERAMARGAHIHAELAGYGLSMDAEHITRPTVAGQARAMARALESAHMSAGDVGYVNAHGTATLANDAVETAAIKEVFGPAARALSVSSTKSMHGHLLGAAGALELAATALAIERRVLPPTMHLTHADPECDLDYVPGHARPVDMLTGAMTNSFAFGGTNVSLVCRAVA
ncbi:MAG TPA: beta-ketoacyl-[acyl-carrier-protein] synthase family protein [Steroidobacteraceae bacterium]|nr:beta-ketoacyl-[acyl-carrier-protein] synthase family protein [Steroidobacteraceae bacterium]